MALIAIDSHVLPAAIQLPNISETTEKIAPVIRQAISFVSRQCNHGDLSYRMLVQFLIGYYDEQQGAEAACRSRHKHDAWKRGGGIADHPRAALVTKQSPDAATPFRSAAWPRGWTCLLDRYLRLRASQTARGDATSRFICGLRWRLRHAGLCKDRDQTQI